MNNLKCFLDLICMMMKSRKQRIFLQNMGAYPQRLKPSIKNALDYVPSLLDLIIPWQ